MPAEIKSLVEKSREVLLDCCLRNGAIVAANSDREDYPHTVQSYRYVWPRDAAYICYALEILGGKECIDAQAAFFRWLSRAEDLSETGILFQNYYTHGRKRWLAFQPDQNGSVLWALHNFVTKHPEHKQEFMGLAKLLSEGLCRAWQKDHFNLVAQDLWETFYTYPELKTTFTYSLAACSRGLRCAAELGNGESWVDMASSVAEEMQKKIDASFGSKENSFLRRAGSINDPRPDASLLGLAWPFAICGAEDGRMIGTVNRIKDRLEKNGGIYRYEYDDYDGFRYQGTDAFRGAGAWPIGNFWMSIYYARLGKKKDAENYFTWVLERLDKNMNIPEQIFENKELVSVKPLAWSHAMLIVAAKELGKI
jgi:glucoamylase